MVACSSTDPVFTPPLALLIQSLIVLQREGGDVSRAKHTAHPDGRLLTPPPEKLSGKLTTPEGAWGLCPTEVVG